MAAVGAWGGRTVAAMTATAIGRRRQEFVVAVIRRRSPCTPARGIATRSSPDLNEAAMLGMLFAPYNEEVGRECTYYERRAIAEEDDGGNGE